MKIPIKEDYSLYNFCKQFSELIINPFSTNYDKDWNWQDYMIWDYRKHWNELLSYNENPDYVVYTVIDNNDGLVLKCIKGIHIVNREGYFIVKIK